MSFTEHTETQTETETSAREDAPLAHAAMGRRIYRAREAFGLSREQLAWRLGLNRAMIVAWEAGGAAPDADQALTLAEALNVPRDWLMRGGCGESSSDQIGWTGAAPA